MRVGSFSVLIPEGKERDSGHVQLAHETKYQIRLGNHGNVRCDAEVSVDGKSVGNFRINAPGFLTLERPSHDIGCFTFFKADSAQGQAVEASEISRNDRGLIQVVFRPEKKSAGWEKTAGGLTGILRSADKSGWNTTVQPRSFNTFAGCGTNATAGVTGLTGQSSQSFHEVPNLDYDPNNETTISLRLVADIYEARKLTPAQPKSNPTPQPVE